MWYGLADKTTGDLLSITSVLPDDAAATFDVIELGADRPDLSAVRWDAATRAFVPVTPPVLIDRADEWRATLQNDFQANAEFMAVYNSLTPARKTALRTSIDAVLTTRLRQVLGHHRWRREGEPMDVD